jgi:hypothetical protein
MTRSVSAREPSANFTSSEPSRRFAIGAEADRHAFRRHLLAEALAELGIEPPQQALAAVGERGFDAQAVEDRRELDRDVTSADQHSAFGKPLEVERFVGGDG